MRFIKTLATISLTGLVLSVNAACAENFDTVKIRSLDNSLEHHRGKIITIREELTSKESDNEQSVKDGEYTDAVLSVLTEITFESERLVESQSQSTESGSESANSTVEAPQNEHAKLLKEKCGNYLEELNLNLDKIKNGAIHFEVKNARDDVVKVCDILRHD